uniref:Programmed cell death protein 5 n=1 Tax=Noctiluca scintillans TaxID=2966 RepID=A0A7S1F4D9_NOCSC|mmetsp:Transcript_33326/g.89214  ORF Transcript_33326/g.89214 Transcript_33326/m.89214 type:complete len:130 (+) Transcript_33326:110-499(+)|eukprot:CAMPEP_0194542510 /NCGR_PEP_ID=MMETSP0253-20130528/84141_1 /TAXON_ID=2966 /ORGANISM="Noctiluca scintillans" /LENGTH=129 /DNA_ID=CAMNT_0039389139 /DNA_START=90 /DNA_END=479 /DNA_ORIENTATION=-
MDKKEEAKAKAAAATSQNQEAQLQQMQEQQEKVAQEQEKKRMMVRQIMEPDALERLNRIRLVKPEKTERLEMQIMQLASTGMLQEKISDSQLVSMLDKIDGSTKGPSVTIQRKQRVVDDDDVDIDALCG